MFENAKFVHRIIGATPRQRLKPKITSHPQGLILMTVEIKINYEKCVRCKECIKACSYGTLEWFDDMPVVVNPKNCAMCLECEKKCPVNAITHKEK